MRKIGIMGKKQIIASLCVVVALAVVSAVTWGMLRHNVRHTDENVKMFSELRDVQKLVLAEMSLNKVGVISDDGATGINAWVNNLKLGDRVAVYSYNTYLEAYIDLSALSPADLSVDADTRHVSLRLPPVQTRFTGRDMEVKEEHYRVTRLRSAISPSERALLKEQMNTSLKAEVESSDEYRRLVADEARTKAISFFTALLESRGYTCNVSVSD